jgi:hypothetical protein
MRYTREHWLQRWATRQQHMFHCTKYYVRRIGLATASHSWVGDRWVQTVSAQGSTNVGFSNSYRCISKILCLKSREFPNIITNVLSFSLSTRNPDFDGTHNHKSNLITRFSTLISKRHSKT